jgi:putative hydrolase of the HAD superfamily
MAPVAGSATDIRCVLFDVGGVLVELAGVSTMLEWMNHRTNADGLWRAWLASPAVRDFERGRIDTTSFAERVVDEFALAVDVDEFLRGFAAWPRGPLPGAHALLDALHPSLIRATLSNSNAAHWPRVMDEMSFARYFDHHFASHLIDRIKPDREAFEHVATTIAVPAQAILFVDDNAINVEAARAFGMRAHRCVGPDETRELLRELDLLA